MYRLRPDTYRMKRSRKAIAVGLAVTVLIAAGYVVVFREPDWLYGSGLSKLPPAQRVTAIDDVHGRMFQFATGLVAVLALTITGLTYLLSRDGHVTDRFTKANEQLGSASTDVRLGAIYSLERIMDDSARDYPTIVELLAAFIREHTKLAGQAERRTKYEDHGGSGPPPLYTDAQAALTVLGRRPTGREERGKLNLQSTDLMGANLGGAVLPGVDLSFADLSGANLTGANLAGANLTGAELAGAVMIGTNLSEANLSHAKLHNVALTKANLRKTDLSYTVLTDSFLDYANLQHADLDCADLTGSNLRAADLTRADLVAATVVRARLVGQRPFDI
jgi:pentapeptide repeat protein